MNCENKLAALRHTYGIISVLASISHGLPSRLADERGWVDEKEPMEGGGTRLPFCVYRTYSRSCRVTDPYFTFCSYRIFIIKRRDQRTKNGDVWNRRRHPLKKSGLSCQDLLLCLPFASYGNVIFLGLFQLSACFLAVGLAAHSRDDDTVTCEPTRVPLWKLLVNFFKIWKWNRCCSKSVPGWYSPVAANGTRFNVKCQVCNENCFVHI